MLGAGRVGGDEGQVDVGRLDGGQFDLGLLGSLAQALQGHAVLGQVDAGILLELVDQPFHDAPVEVVAAEVRVAVGGLHFEHAFPEFQDGNVESAAAEVVHGDGLLLLLILVEPESERRGGRFVDDALDLESRDLARVLGGLALGIVEIGGNGDHGFGDRFAQIVLGGLLHLLEDEGGNFLWGVHLFRDVHADILALLLDLVGYELHFARNL